MGAESGKMAVQGGDPAAVIDNDGAAVAGAIARRQHKTISRHPNCLSVAAGNVHAEVPGALAVERVNALAEAGAEPPAHRP